MKKCPHYRIAP